MIEQKDPINEIFSTIISIKESLPNKQKMLCDYILENYASIGLITVKELADKAGVGTTTVLRVMNALGYNSFQEMKKDFHNLSLETSNKWRIFQESFKEKNDDQEFKTLSDVWEEGIYLLDKTLNPTLIENFKLAMDLITKAGRINILGLRPYKAVAIYLELLMEEFYSKTRQLSYDSDSMFERILQFQKDEILIIFSFEPYTSRTYDAAEVAHERGIPVILVTEHLSCPIVPFASVTLKVENSKKQFSILPIIALVEAMVIELGKRTSDESISKIDRLMDVLKEKNVTL